MTPTINSALRAGTLDIALTPARLDDIEISVLAEVLQVPRG
ncbi:hypothetical protein [Polaromonas sp.]|nr:hypothetical protein [Polaromonas sp.]MDI1339893.1 hypothetical protein [Polaromonas sp.]